MPFLGLGTPHGASCFPPPDPIISTETFMLRILEWHPYYILIISVDSMLWWLLIELPSVICAVTNTVYELGQPFYFSEPVDTIFIIQTFPDYLLILIGQVF